MLKFVFYTSIIINECCVLGFWSIDNYGKTMAEQPKITEKQSTAFASDQKTASALTHRLSHSGFCFIADRSKSHTDLHLENILVNNIGTSELLTKREAQILRYILDGKTNNQIALMLSKSRRTIEYHRNRLMRKLNAHNTIELVKKAVAMGIAWGCYICKNFSQILPGLFKTY